MRSRAGRKRIESRTSFLNSLSTQRASRSGSGERDLVAHRGLGLGMDRRVDGDQGLGDRSLSDLVQLLDRDIKDLRQFFTQGGTTLILPEAILGIAHPGGFTAKASGSPVHRAHRVDDGASNPYLRVGAEGDAPCGVKPVHRVDEADDPDVDEFGFFRAGKATGQPARDDAHQRVVFHDPLLAFVLYLGARVHGLFPSKGIYHVRSQVGRRRSSEDPPVQGMSIRRSRQTERPRLSTSRMASPKKGCQVQPLVLPSQTESAEPGIHMETCSAQWPPVRALGS